MSEFHVKVVELGKVGKHPNADSLSISNIYAYPVIFRTGEFEQGDRVVYVPIDAVMPDKPEYAFLGSSRRVKAKKLRGIFSMGLLLRAPDGTLPGDDVREILEVTKYEPPLDHAVFNTENERDPGFIPVYTDIEGWRRYPNKIAMGDDVIVTEKIHGANARFCFSQGRLWVGSHRQIKKEDPRNLWWQVAARENLATKLAKLPDFIFYGEVYGQVQKGFKYDATPETPCKLRIFDVYSIEKGHYMDYSGMMLALAAVGLEPVVELARGPLVPEMLELRNGKSTLNPDTIREGIVIKPMQERWDFEIGRVVLKFVGENYLLAK